MIIAHLRKRLSLPFKLSQKRISLRSLLRRSGAERANEYSRAIPYVNLKGRI